jgi:dihydroorotate dehydrogenase (NAD+) catalytic subunit
VGTATFWNPRAPLRIAAELDEFMKANQVKNVRDLVGTLRLEG